MSGESFVRLDGGKSKTDEERLKLIEATLSNLGQTIAIFLQSITSLAETVDKHEKFLVEQFGPPEEDFSE